MRNLVEWFNARRRQVALALIGLVALVVVSSGDRGNDAGLFRIPDLGALVIAGFAVLALVGLFLFVFAKPGARGPRRPGEIRSIRSVLFMTVVVAAAIWLNPPDLAELEEPAPVSEEADAVADPLIEAPGGSAVSGTDLAALGLMVAVGVVLLVRTMMRSRSIEAELPTPEASSDEDQLLTVLAEMRRQLEDATDPRSGVLVAYATLEDALEGAGMPRHPPETPTEHLRRVLSDMPHLVDPVLELGSLYEIARFSDASLTDDDRWRASSALRQVLDRLVDRAEHE